MTIEGKTSGADKYISLSRRILRLANRGTPRIVFLREVSDMLLDFSACDAIELRLKDNELYYRWKASSSSESCSGFEVIYANSDRSIDNDKRRDEYSLERICNDVISDRYNPNLPYFTKYGTFWINDTQNSIKYPFKSDNQTDSIGFSIGGDYRSLALIPFQVDDDTSGLMQLMSMSVNHFTVDEIKLFEGVSQTLGIAVADRRAQAALRERVKELTCLYGIAQIAEQEILQLGDKMQQIVEILPASWQYPEIAVARIVLNDNTYSTAGFRKGCWQQTANIIVSGQKRGTVEVAYVEDRPELAEGPFLKEEASLIEEVARQVATIIEKEETARDREILHEQLRHADRLATIGQLAAGVAHELNEPLGSILGFAQLANKNLANPTQSERDLKKIVDASLHARDIVRKLLIFARQVPAKKMMVNVNRVIWDALTFFESRCQKEGIDLLQQLDDDLPEIEADPAQINQILVNLVVNAIHAMPNGGKLIIKTAKNKKNITLSVEDNGVGMPEHVKQQIFMPFYTTKDIKQGTGLGLSVVHGIVSSHGGSIEVFSGVNRGSLFKINLSVSGKIDPTGDPIT